MSNHLAIGPQRLSNDASAPPQRFHVEAGRGELEVQLDLPKAFSGTVEWFQNGTPIPGVSGSALKLSNLRPSDTDIYSAQMTEGRNNHASQSFLLVVTPSLSLTDQSARANVSIDHPLICGFVVGRGSGVEASKTYLIRVVTTSLKRFGIESPLADPQVSLARRNQDISHLMTMDRAFHDEWAPRLGAFALEDSANEFVAHVDLGAGNYTLNVSSASSSDSGEVLVEIYEISQLVEGKK